jgi:hypothetical protein
MISPSCRVQSLCDEEIVNDLYSYNLWDVPEGKKPI